MKYLTVVCLLAAVSLPFCAAEAADPSGEEILDRVAETLTGGGTLDRFKNRVVKGMYSLPGQGLSASLTIYVARPNRNYTVIESEALGKVEKGSNGEVAWSRSVMTGPVLMTGQQKTDFLRDSDFEGIAAWRRQYESVRYAGSEDVDGRPCHKVKVVPKGGAERTMFVDAETWLIAKITTVADTPGGKIPVESFFTEYAVEDGLPIAHRVSILAMGQEQRIVVESVEHDADLPGDLFELPDEVRELVEAE